MTRLGLIVTDASPLITLAAAEALDCLTIPGLPVLIPDMVYFEVTQDLSKTGAGNMVAWATHHRGQVEVVMTETFVEFQILREVNPKTKSKGRGEISAIEVLNTAINADPEIEAILLFEDNDIKKRNFIRALPERVMALSTGDLLRELETAGLILSSEQILDIAAKKEQNVAQQRQPSIDESARQAFRRHLQLSISA